jgi:hypothetical protein
MPQYSQPQNPDARGLFPPRRAGPIWDRRPRCAFLSRGRGLRAHQQHRPELHHPHAHHFPGAMLVSSILNLFERVNYAETTLADFGNSGRASGWVSQQFSISAARSCRHELFFSRGPSVYISLQAMDSLFSRWLGCRLRERLSGC